MTGVGKLKFDVVCSQNPHDLLCPRGGCCSGADVTRPLFDLLKGPSGSGSTSGRMIRIPIVTHFLHPSSACSGRREPCRDSNV